MKARAWIELGLQLPFSYQDLLTGQLAAIGFSGFLQDDGHLACFTPKRRWTGSLRLRLQNILKRFGTEFPELNVRYKQRISKERNWNKAWEDSVGVVHATDRITIKPSWRKTRIRDKHGILIQIDPKMSFGTGHHETTRLTLRLLQEHLQPRSSVLDFGSGTGILAIAAAKLGAQSVLAVDNDEWATSNAKENVRKNRLVKRVRILKGNAKRIPNKAFDLIVANIDLLTILQSLRTLLKHLRPQGVLILSGLLLADLPALFPKLSKLRLVQLQLIAENEWVALSFVRSR